MATEVYLFVALVAIAIVYVTRRVWEGLRFRGKMLVTCPETHEPAAVKVNVPRAAMRAIAGRKEHELCDCSRWPERGGCDQDCLEQVEQDPENHRVWTIAAHWYAGKKCAYCQKPIETLSHFDRSPALLDRARKTAEWDSVPAENLPGEFSKRLARLLELPYRSGVLARTSGSCGLPAVAEGRAAGGVRSTKRDCQVCKGRRQAVVKQSLVGSWMAYFRVVLTRRDGRFRAEEDRARVADGAVGKHSTLGFPA